MNVKQKFVDSLVEDWKQAYKWFSVQSMFIFTAIMTFAVTNREEFDTLMNAVLPQWAQGPVVAFLGVASIYMRLRDQTKGKDTNNG
jgi:hypothetical protein